MLRDKPRVVTDGKRIIVSLDGHWVRDPEGKYVEQHSPLREEDRLCFTVTRQGKLKFAKKVTVKPKFEKRTKLDDEGQPVPNELHQEDLKNYGHSYHPEFESENVLLEDADVYIENEVDRDWWSRNAYISVKF